MGWENSETIKVSSKLIDSNTEGGKIALRCGEQTFCLRGHMEYQYGRISPEFRKGCPITCCLNKEFDYYKDIYPLTK